MYHEEKVINDVLCWRGTPDGEWNKFSDNVLTDRLVKSNKCNSELVTELEGLVDWLHDNRRCIEGEFDMDVLLADARKAIVSASKL